MNPSTQFRTIATGNPSQASRGGLNTPHRSWRGQTQPQKHIRTMPFLPDPDFIERPDILTFIREVCTRAPYRVALVGVGGIGKSQLTIHNAYRIREQHPDTWVFWVDGSTRERFRSSYCTIAEQLDLLGRDDPKVDVLQLVSEWLQVEGNGPWHMILDSADEVDVFFSAQSPLSSFLPQSRNGSIAITSRSTDVAQRLVGSTRDILTVPPMTTDEAYSLLRAKLGNNVDDGETAKLVAALSYTPLAITQATALIKNGGLLIRQYLNEFQMKSQKKVSIPNKDACHLGRYFNASNPVITSCQITLDHLRREYPSATELLSFMSFCHPHSIPVYLLRAHRTGRTKNSEDEEDIDHDLQVLHEYCLVATTVDKDVFSIHDLVQVYIQTWLSSLGGAQRWRTEFLRVISEEYPPGDRENWGACQQLEPHAEMIIQEQPVAREDVIRWCKLVHNVGWYRAKRGRYQEAEAMIRRALEARGSVLGQDHPDTLCSMNNLGLVLLYQGMYEEAEVVHRGVLEIRKTTLGSEHPSTLGSMNNLGVVLRSQKRHAEAEAIHRHVLEIRERVLSPGHPHTHGSKVNLELVLRDQGKHEEAEVVGRRAIWNSSNDKGCFGVLKPRVAGMHVVVDELRPLMGRDIPNVDIIYGELPATIVALEVGDEDASLTGVRMDWDNICWEIRHEILSHLAQATPHKKGTLARYASVSREWQPVFERLSLRSLRIRTPELGAFRDVFYVHRRRRYLQHVGLILELPKHKHVPFHLAGGTSQENSFVQMILISTRGSGSSEVLPWVEKQQAGDAEAFAMSLCTLFKQLTLWTREQSHPDGIALEVIADSKSYWQQTALEIRQRPTPVVIYTRVVSDPREFQALNVSSYRLGKTLDDADQDFHFTLDLDLRQWDKSAPMVQVVSGLSILRNSVRHFHPQAISHILNRLPLLKSFMWETRQHIHWKSQHWFYEHLVKAMSMWPTSLEKIEITQLNSLGSRHHSRPRVNPHLTPFASGLAAKCQYLTILSIDYGVDAFEFFARPHQLRNLQRLVLRSEQMIVGELPSSGNPLINMAAQAAYQMPNLKFLALYNMRGLDAGVFSYEIFDGVALLGLRCSWAFSISQESKSLWDAVPSCRVAGYVKWHVERMSFVEVKYCTSVIRQRTNDLE
ncbi:hypothetical protein NM208_g3397 [Fusarium decemcellulare]|uniref:Uncharacterized protein n=1 Tax=Fusarium decemcellulare TaxID=57161 RepID=A0ACC1SPE9_9HYPO|nr:hypothetical protein NM208_g3397 [Fusarium decemcellulare]